MTLITYMHHFDSNNKVHLLIFEECARMLTVERYPGDQQVQFPHFRVEETRPGLAT